MTLSLINSNKDFDLNLLVKFHYVKEITHDVSSLLALVKTVVASHQKIQRNQFLSRLYLLTIENINSDLT